MSTTSASAQNCPFHSDRQTDICGTMRKNRIGLPKTLTAMKLGNEEKKQVRYTDDGSMKFLKWKDERDVVILSTFHKGGEEVKVLRRKKEVNTRIK
jgi:hypothetical protein